jgi:hypothetical protein
MKRTVFQTNPLPELDIAAGLAQADTSLVRDASLREPDRPPRPLGEGPAGHRPQAEGEGYCAQGEHPVDIGTAAGWEM